MNRGRLLVVLVAVGAVPLLALPAAGQEKKPNILAIFGDDVGQTNI